MEASHTTPLSSRWLPCACVRLLDCTPAQPRGPLSAPSRMRLLNTRLTRAAGGAQSLLERAVVCWALARDRPPCRPRCATSSCSTQPSWQPRWARVTQAACSSPGSSGAEGRQLPVASVHVKRAPAAGLMRVPLAVGERPRAMPAARRQPKALACALLPRQARLARTPWDRQLETSQHHIQCSTAVARMPDQRLLRRAFAHACSGHSPTGRP